MAKHRRYSKKRTQKGGLVNNDKQILRDLGFTENDINYIFGRHRNMQIDFFFNSVNGIPGSQFYPHPKAPSQVMRELRDEGDFTDEEDSSSFVVAEGIRKSKRRTKKQKKTRKHKRRQYGGNMTVTEDLSPQNYKDDEYNQIKNLQLYPKQ